MSGHRIPQETTAPRRAERLTRCGQIIPAPTYVMLKSKKNLMAGIAHNKNQGSEFREVAAIYFCMKYSSRMSRSMNDNILLRVFPGLEAKRRELSEAAGVATGVEPLEEAP
jgi:hypothetical protein